MRLPVLGHTDRAKEWVFELPRIKPHYSVAAYASGNLVRNSDVVEHCKALLPQAGLK